MNGEIVRDKTSGAEEGGLQPVCVSSCSAAVIGIIPLCILMLSVSDRHAHTLFCVLGGGGLFTNSLHTRLQPVVLMSGWVRAVEKLWLLIHLEILFIFSVPFLSNPSPKRREQPWVVFLEGFRVFKLSPFLPVKPKITTGKKPLGSGWGVGNPCHREDDGGGSC